MKTTGFTPSRAAFDERQRQNLLLAIDGAQSAPKKEDDDANPERRQKSLELVKTLGLQYRDACLVCDQGWVNPIIRALHDNKVQITEIQPQHHRNEAQFAITVKPTHCPSKMKASRVQIVVGQSGFSTRKIIKGVPNESDVAFRCLTAYEAVHTHAVRLSQIDRVARLAPNRGDVSTKLYDNPWAIHVANFFSPLPVKLSRLVFCQSEKGPYVQFAFQSTRVETNGLFIELALSPHGRNQTRPPKDFKDSPQFDPFISTAWACSKSIGHVYRLLENVPDQLEASRILFLNPGLISCLSFAAHHGAVATDISIHHGLNKTTVELLLAHRNWHGNNGQPPKIVLSQSSILNHNINANGHYSLTETLENIAAHIQTPNWLNKVARTYTASYHR